MIMKNKNGFTLIELLAVIAVLVIVTIISIQGVLHNTPKARLDAFAIEATSIIESAEKATENLNNFNLKNNVESCKIGTKVCLTIDELIRLEFYDGENDSYKGKVIIDLANNNEPKYTLYLQR